MKNFFSNSSQGVTPLTCSVMFCLQAIEAQKTYVRFVVISLSENSFFYVLNSKCKSHIT